MEIAALYIGSYLLGSIPTAYIIGRLVGGLDILGYGSGNVGSANLYEHVGKKWVVPLVAIEILVKGGAPHLGQPLCLGHRPVVGLSHRPSVAVHNRQ